MASTLLNRPLNYARDGEPVDAATTKRPIAQLLTQVKRLRDQLAAFGSGNKIVLFDVPVEATVSTGMPVYYNSATSRFAPALAANNLTGDSPAASAVVWGFVKVHVGTLTADLTVYGIEDDLDLTAAGFAEPEAGEYYLSGMTAGRIQTSQAAVPVRVCTVGPNGSVFICPQPVGAPDGHSHYSFELVAEPAGIPTVIDFGPTGMVASIESADSNLPGWLPADDAIFDGEAPDGAVFGYNISKHPELQAVWPPDPLSAASIVVYSDLAAWYGHEVRSDSGGLVKFTRHGIWWMSTSASDVPWSYPEDSESIPASLSAALTSDRKVRLYFSRSRYANYRTAVTSLESDTPALEIVSACNGEAASQGPLIIRWNPDYENSEDDNLGELAIKEFNAGQFKRGPVLAGLIAQDDTVTLTSDHTMPHPDDEDVTIYYGLVTVKYNDAPRELTIPAQIIKLDGGQQRYESDLLAVGIAAGAGVRLKFKLPGSSRFPSNSVATLRLWLSGNNGSSLPNLTVTRRRVPRVTTAASIPVTDTAVSLTMPGVVNDGQYIEIESDDWAVQPDDLIMMEVSRADGDGYSGEVLIIDAHLRVYDSTTV